MSLQEAMKEEQEKMIREYGGKPIPRKVWEKYTRELAENRERFEAEERVRIARTHQLAITTVVV